MRSSGFGWTLKPSLRDLIIFSKLLLLLTYRLHYNFNYESKTGPGRVTSATFPRLWSRSVLHLCKEVLHWMLLSALTSHAHVEGFIRWLLRSGAVTNHSESVLVPVYQSFPLHKTIFLLQIERPTPTTQKCICSLREDDSSSILMNTGNLSGSWQQNSPENVFSEKALRGSWQFQMAKTLERSDF